MITRTCTYMYAVILVLIGQARKRTCKCDLGEHGLDSGPIHVRVYIPL